jgi:hypothetical protein
MAKVASRTAPVRREHDSDAMRETIDWLEANRVRPLRPTAYQVKVGFINFYPDKGTIQMDGDPRPHAVRGFEEFKRLVELRMDYVNDLTNREYPVLP